MIEMTMPEIEQLLDNARIGRLGMADRDGRPYVIPMPFCWHDGAIYLRLPMTGRKSTILARNDWVCFEADEFTERLDVYASVLIEGRLVPVASEAEKNRVREVNSAKYSRLRHGYRPGHGRSKSAGELPVRKILVESISGRKKEPAGFIPRCNGAVLTA